MTSHRLYSWLRSDEMKEKTFGARNHMSWEINYGSAKNSNRFASVMVSWPEGDEKPTIVVAYSD